jgi:hypothetical protein
LTRRLAAAAVALLAGAALAACAPGSTAAGITARSAATEAGGAPAGGGTAASVGASGGAAAATPVRQHVTGQAPAPESCRYRRAADGQDLPDPRCTPGATDPRVTQADIASTICVRGYTALVRPPVEETDRAKHALMLAYGQSRPNELDHLIPLELGGSSDVRNLWPEMPPSPNPKDQVENELRNMVCAAVWYPGAAYLPLDVARRLIADDWTTALEQAKTEVRP